MPVSDLQDDPALFIQQLVDLLKISGHPLGHQLSEAVKRRTVAKLNACLD
jgi:hypothetical protein